MTHKDKKKLKWIIIGGALASIVSWASLQVFKGAIDIINDISRIDDIELQSIQNKYQIRKVKKRLHMR